MISTANFRKGAKIDYKGEPCEIIDFQHVKMGRGGAMVRTKLKGMITGSVIEENFRSGEKFDSPQLEEKEMQYLYEENEMLYFMDAETYEQVPMTQEQLTKEKMRFLKENTVVKILYYKGNPIAVELPTFVELVVAETDPGFKGDTASGGSKPATLETGAAVRVPFHINTGDIIKVDTRTSEYIERVK